MACIHPLKKIVEDRKQGKPAGICSICNANAYVIEAAVDTADTD